MGKPAGVTTLEADNAVSSPEAGVYIACLSAQQQLFLCFGQQAAMITFQEKLSAQKGHQLVLDMHTWEAANILSGTVHIYPETLEKLTPHMINYHHSNAVSFTKGCFLGQEVIARTQHRGRSKRKLYRCTIQNSTPIRLGTEIMTKKDEPAGIVVALSEIQANTTHALVVLADHTIKSALYIEKAVLEDLTLAHESAPQLALAD
jgi:folate-binding protein YgfZ